MDTTQNHQKAKETENTTEKSLEEGNKAIEINKKTAGHQKKDAESKEKEDAEQWRNEG